MLEALLFGIIQGIVEFFPVSSTGHLIILQTLPGSTISLSPSYKIFDAAVQIGSGCALLLIFLRAWMKEEVPFLKNLSILQMAKILTIASLPVILTGVFFYSFIKTWFYIPIVVVWMELLGGIFFILLERKKNSVPTERCVTDTSCALSIGLWQVIALIPGISRSGSTIFGARCMNVSRQDAVLFSFWIAIPILLGAGSFDIMKCLTRGTGNLSDVSLVVCGVVSSFFASLLIARSALSFLIKYGLTPFGWYRIGFAILSFWLLA